MSMRSRKATRLATPDRVDAVKDLVRDVTMLNVLVMGVSRAMLESTAGARSDYALALEWASRETEGRLFAIHEALS